jgi:hypothetical protein
MLEVYLTHRSATFQVLAVMRLFYDKDCSLASYIRLNYDIL